jgi:hypothetical protein
LKYGFEDEKGFERTEREEWRREVDGGFCGVGRNEDSGLRVNAKHSGEWGD